MPNALHCPNDHVWPPPKHVSAEDSRCYGECPQCGELVAVDAPIPHPGCRQACLIILAAILFPLIVAITFSVMGAPKEAIQALGAVCTFGGVFASLFFSWRFRVRRLREITEMAEVLGLQHNPKVAPERFDTLKMFPLFADASKVARRSSRFELIGFYRDSRVFIFDLYTHGSQGQFGETVVVYLDAVEGIPDFDLEAAPAGSESVYNKDVFEMIGLRRRRPAEDLLRGEGYKLKTENLDAADEFFNEERREWLSRIRGWHVQVREGRMVFRRPNLFVPAPMIGTLLAITWRFREILISPPDIDA